MYSIRIWDLIGKNAKPFEICPNFPPSPSPPKVVNRPGVAGAVLQIAFVYQLSLHRKKMMDLFLSLYKNQSHGDILNICLADILRPASLGCCQLLFSGFNKASIGVRRTMRGTSGREPHNPYQIPNIPYQIWNCMSF